MACLAESVLNLLSNHDDAEKVLREYREVYTEHPEDFLCLLLYQCVQVSHTEFLQILLQEECLQSLLGLPDVSQCGQTSLISEHHIPCQEASSDGCPEAQPLGLRTLSNTVTLPGGSAILKILPDGAIEAEVNRSRSFVNQSSLLSGSMCLEQYNNSEDMSTNLRNKFPEIETNAHLTASALSQMPFNDHLKSRVDQQDTLTGDLEPGMKNQKHLFSDEDLAMALNVAVWKENIQCIDLILNFNPILVDIEGKVISEHDECFMFTPLELSMKKDSVKMLHHLLHYSEHFSISCIEDRTGNPIHIAIKYRATDCLKYLLGQNNAQKYLSEENASGIVPLILAAYEYPESIPFLLSNGAYPLMTHKGKGALAILCDNEIIESPNVFEMNIAPTNTLLKSSDVTSCMSMECVGRFDIINKIIQSDLCSMLRQINHNRPDQHHNGHTSPMVPICSNIYSDFSYRRHDIHEMDDWYICEKYRCVLGYLASISNQKTNATCLQHLISVVSQTAMWEFPHVDEFYSFIKLNQQLIAILLAHGADPRRESLKTTSSSNTERFFIMVPEDIVPGVLRSVMSTNSQFPDIAQPDMCPFSFLKCLLNKLIPSRSISKHSYLCESESADRINMKWTHRIYDIHIVLLKHGVRCHNIINLFISICVDPIIYIQFLETYLIFHKYDHGQKILHSLVNLTKHQGLTSEQKNILSGLRQNMAALTLPNLQFLTKRCIITNMGKQFSAPNINKLHLPHGLKEELQLKLQ